MKKYDARMELRLPCKFKEELTRYCTLNKFDCSEYIRAAIEEKMYRESPEYLCESVQFQNRLCNIVYAFPKLDKHFKETLLKEIINYDR